MSSPTPGLDEDGAFWRTLAEERGRVIQALHEFNYWHASTVARGEVIVGLERSVELWRERCLAAEANPGIAAEVHLPVGPEPTMTPKRFVLRVAHRVLHPLHQGVERRLEAE